MRGESAHMAVHEDVWCVAILRPGLGRGRGHEHQKASRKQKCLCGKLLQSSTTCTCEFMYGPESWTGRMSMSVFGLSDRRCFFLMEAGWATRLTGRAGMVVIPLGASAAFRPFSRGFKTKTSQSKVGKTHAPPMPYHCLNGLSTIENHEHFMQ